MTKVRKAVIPAAGLGTRFLPATKAMAKEMLPIVDKPTIQYIVEEALASGIEDILIVTGKSKRPIEDHFDSNIELESNLEAKGKTECLGCGITTAFGTSGEGLKGQVWLGNAKTSARFCRRIVGSI